MKYQDIHRDDVSSYEQFKSAISAGRLPEAEAIFAQDRFDDKRIDAKAINDFGKRLKQGQRNIYDNVNDVLNSYLDRISNGLANFKKVGDFDPDPLVEYYENNIVNYHGTDYYLALQYSGDKPTPPSFPWIKIDTRGKNGTNALTDLKLVGEYNASTAYAKNDLVFSGDNFYWAKQPSTGKPVSNTAYWGLLIDGMAQDMVVSYNEDGLDDEDIWLQIIKER